MVSAVFLDRDGVINANLERNGKPVAPTSLAEFRILPGVAEAARLLKEAGFLLVVVTNQPDVANGLTSREMVEAQTWAQSGSSPGWTAFGRVACFLLRDDGALSPGGFIPLAEFIAPLLDFIGGA
jgi:hypothetical protein